MSPLTVWGPVPRPRKALGPRESWDNKLHVHRTHGLRTLVRTVVERQNSVQHHQVLLLQLASDSFPVPLRTQNVVGHFFFASGECLGHSGKTS